MDLHRPTSMCKNIVFPYIQQTLSYNHSEYLLSLILQTHKPFTSTCSAVNLKNDRRSQNVAYKLDARHQFDFWSRMGVGGWGRAGIYILYIYI